MLSKLQHQQTKSRISPRNRSQLRQGGNDSELERTQNDKISVVIPTYNDAKYLRLTLRSLLEQNRQPYEIVIIDDCPTDKKTKMMLEKNFQSELKNRTIRYYKNQRNLGAGGARNRGVDLVHGDLVVFCDSDDIFLPHHLEAMFEARVKNNADVVILNTKIFIDKDGQVIRQRKYKLRGSIEYKLFVLGLTGAYMLMRPELAKELGGFRADMVASRDKQMFAEDWEFSTRIFHAGYKIVMCDEGTYQRRKHSRSLTGSYLGWTKYRREVLFPRIATDPNFTRRQLAIFTYGTLVSAPMRQIPALFWQLLKLQPFFFIVQPAWVQLARISLGNRMRRRLNSVKIDRDE